MRILVVCGAGASSTFVAQRLQRAAREAGREHVVAAIALAHVAAHLADADLLLIGPHLSSEIDRITTEASQARVEVIALPNDVFADRDGTRTLDLAEGAASLARPHRSEGTR